MFRLIRACAAFFSIPAAALTVASLLIADRAPRRMEFLGVSLVVGAVFLGIGVLLACLLLGGGRAFACAVLGWLTYAILGRIDQGFAVFG